MYEKFYRLSGDPFRLLPDAEICFSHASCAHAWSYLRYATKRGEGIVVVSGMPGSGKTTLAERLLRDANRAQTLGVRLVAHSAEPSVLLRTLAHAFGLDNERLDDATLAYRLERFLIDLALSNRRALVIVDEAHTLSYESLEAMRLLTDLQSNSRPVMQLILFGQEELEMMLSAPRLAQIQQRVIASCRLSPMTAAETKAYLEYRLAYVDWQGTPSIDGAAVTAIHRHSGGLPRQINKICSRLFLYASAEEKRALTEQDVQTVVDDFCDELLELFTGAADASAAARRVDAEAVWQLALVPPQRKSPGPSVPPEGAAWDARRQGVTAAPVRSSQHIAPRGPSATAARPGITRHSIGASAVSGYHHMPRFGLAFTRKVRSGRVFLLSAARSLRIEAARLARSTATMVRTHGAAARKKLAGQRFGNRLVARIRSTASSIRTWATQVSGDQLASLGRWAARSMPLAQKGMRAFARMRPQARRSMSLARLARISPGHRRALAMVAGITLVTVVTAFVWLGPRPQDDAAPSNVVQPVSVLPIEITTITEGVETPKPTDASLPGDYPAVDQLSGLESAALLAATADQLLHGPNTVELAKVRPPRPAEAISASDNMKAAPAVSQKQTAPTPTDAAWQSDYVALGELGGLEPEVLLATTVDQLFHGLDMGEQAMVRVPRTEEVIPAIDTRKAEPDLPLGSEPEQAIETPPVIRPVAEIDDTSRLLMDHDPSATLPAPAAGRSGSPAAATLFTEGDPLKLMPAHSGQHRQDDGLLQVHADGVVALISPDHGNIEFELASDASAPPASAESASDDADQIERWLELANTALRRDRLLFPESDSAVRYFRLILEQDAGHSEATAGIERIVERYLSLAGKAFERREFERAEQFIGRAMRVSPNHAGPRELRKQIATTIAEEQAEADRQRQAEIDRRLAAEATARAEAAREAELAREREFAEMTRLFNL